MKSALAAMLVAASRLSSSAPSRGRLSLLFTADEENGSAYGAHHVCQSIPLHADGVVIGEPGGIEADYDRLHLVSRGIARLRLVARGRQGHSSLSDVLAARNAGVDAARLVTEVAHANPPEVIWHIVAWVSRNLFPTNLPINHSMDPERLRPTPSTGHRPCYHWHPAGDDEGTEDQSALWPRNVYQDATSGRDETPDGLSDSVGFGTWQAP
jgi:acetylornithine deacetylase/succinyl-diaminopimelate desuccinylase-like protein